MLGWVESGWEDFWTDPRSGGKIGAVFATGGGITQGVEDVLAGLTRVLWSFRCDLARLATMHLTLHVWPQCT
jgi:hypothetical protein